MKKKAVILSIEKIVCTYIKNQMDKLLGDLVEFSSYSLEEGIPGKIACELCIFPTEDRVNLTLIAEKLMPGTKFLSVKRTLLNGEWQKLSSLPYGTKALLVNTSQKLSIEAISFLLELGANHIHFEPYYPGAGEYPDYIRVAVTPDEIQCVPEGIDTIVNIGPRVIDSSTFFELMTMLKLFNRDTKDRLLQYSSMVMPNNPGLNNFMNQLVPENEYLKEVVTAFNRIVIACDNQGKIIYSSQSNKQIAPKIIYGRSITECLENIQLGKPGELHNEVFDIGGSQFLVDKIETIGDDREACSIFFFSSFKEVETSLHVYRQKKFVANKAKYTFKDINGNSDAINKVKQIAMRAAETELDILIEAETGTGKELLANSIHNASHRKNGPFIAFNCAAISSSLMESELFGYEDGAFTGAKKGGRVGLIEAANNGTLFLDEVGEISISTQVKLLRVLQEREVIRVGGTDRIPVNIRVIAATNKNLDQMVTEGTFRKDLFYRLNVLPIRIPPLRERKEDVMLLISSILNDRNIKIDISDEVIQALSNYEWPGNIRELINCCEYIINMERKFTIETLPYYMKEKILARGSAMPTEQNGGLRFDVSRKEERQRMLELIYDRNKRGVCVGRKTLTEALTESGIRISEAEVRTVLEELCNERLIVSHRGRGGTKISEKGMALIAERSIR